jgi:hypothetical protein
MDTNKFSAVSYEEKARFNVQTHFKEHIMFVSWGSPVFWIKKF